MTSDRLRQDFSPDQERTQRALQVLYTTLTRKGGSVVFQSAYERWAGLVSMATEFGQQTKPGRTVALQKSFEAAGLTAEQPDFGRFLFATHTFFATVAKLLAVLALGRTGSLPGLSLKKWASLSDRQLAENFCALESGALFHEAGLAGFLEGDCFGWYAPDLPAGLLDCWREVVARLAECEADMPGTAAESSPDCLKGLYCALVPAALRKTLGEFYTPDRKSVV